MVKRIDLIVPDPTDAPEPGESVTPLFIEPEGRVPGRETPGFFVVRIAGEWVYPETEKSLPRQFLSLAAVNEFLTDRYGPAPPLRVSKYIDIDGATLNFPAIWMGTRGKGKNRATVQVRYIGSFRYWDGRRVDPTKVGTSYEFN